MEEGLLQLSGRAGWPQLRLRVNPMRSDRPLISVSFSSYIQKILRNRCELVGDPPICPWLITVLEQHQWRRYFSCHHDSVLRM
jgi:hypothetical protein